MKPPATELTQIAGIIHSLRACRLFSGVASEELNVIASLIRPKHLKKGAYLFREGDQAEGFYVVQTGSINVHRVNHSGKEQVISVFRSGQSFAEAAVASSGGYPADARAVEASNVLLVPKAEFVELLRTQPELALRMLAAMSQHLRTLVGRLDDLTLKDVETRLANWLLKRCPKPTNCAPATVELDRTKRVLAAELGTTSETLSRTLAKFRDSNLLTVSGNTITVSNPIEIEALLRKNLGEA